MRAIKRQFGNRFAEIFSQCPTLLKDLAQMRSAGVKIRRIRGHRQAFSELERMTIFISKSCSRSYALVSIAHEKVHLLVTPTPPPRPDEMTRSQFIALGLKSETDAICHSMKVAVELQAIGHPLDRQTRRWYHIYKKGGRAAVRRAIKNAITSNTGDRYEDYYGQWYDSEVEDEDDARCPSPTCTLPED